MITKEELRYLTDDDLRRQIETNVIENLIVSSYLAHENHVVISIDNRYATYVLNELNNGNYKYRQIPKNGDVESVRELYEIELND